MTDGNIHGTQTGAVTAQTLAPLFAILLTLQLLGLVLVHSYVLIQVDGPSTFDTLRAVWAGGIVFTCVLFAVEFRS